MLTPEQIDALRDAAGRLTDPVNEFLIDDIARRVSEAGQLTGTAAYQTWIAQQMGMSHRELKRELQKRLDVSGKELQALLTQAAEAGYEFDLKRFPHVHGVPFAHNGALQQIVAAVVDKVQEDFANLTQTLGFIAPDGKSYPLTEAYQKTCGFAFGQVVTGAADYNTAMRRAVKNLADHGVRTVDYETGRPVSLEAAVRRNVMGGLGLLQEEIGRHNFKELGADGWEITAHANSAPDHEPVQGRQFKDEEFRKLNNSLKRRIGTMNCGHMAFPVVVSANTAQYTDEELAAFREENERGVTYEGRHYTGYEATQVQRKLEQSIRRQKRRVTASEATGDAEQLAVDKTRLTRLNQEYARFSKAAGLRTERERTWVQVAKPAFRDILKEDGLFQVTEQAVERVPLVTGGILDGAGSCSLQRAHRELLRYVEADTVGTEAAQYFDLDMKLLDRYKGGLHSVRAKTFSVPYIASHNHPDGLIFSPLDMKAFIESGNMVAMSVVGNNGAVYMLSKLERYDAAGFIRHYKKMSVFHKDRMESVEKYTAFMNDFLGGAEDYGVCFERG